MNAALSETAALESLLAFWRDAGVEACFEDAPVDRTHVEPPPALKAVNRATASVTPVADDRQDAAEARRMAAAAGDLEALAAAAAAFDGCPLRGLGARQPLFGRGDPAAALLVIGEAPGAEDDAGGEPFSGAAGRLLDRMLAAADLQTKAYRLNTVFWRPPGDRAPTQQEQAVCAPFVERAFALIRPRAVLLLGAAAARSVLQTDESVMRLRGEWREWRLPEGDVHAPAIATFSPAFLLRQPQAKRQAWADVLRLAARLETGDTAERLNGRPESAMVGG